MQFIKKYLSILQKYILKLFQTIAHIINYGAEFQAYGMLLKNACLGMFNSQFFLAQYYFEKRKDYVEAYAWAEVSYRRGHPQALALKKTVEKSLEPAELNKAVSLARIYKSKFLPS